LLDVGKSLLGSLILLLISGVGHLWCPLA
jgi:hypothetical protein